MEIGRVPIFTVNDQAPSLPVIGSEQPCGGAAQPVDHERAGGPARTEHKLERNAVPAAATAFSARTASYLATHHLDRRQRLEHLDGRVRQVARKTDRGFAILAAARPLPRANEGIEHIPPVRTARGNLNRADRRARHRLHTLGYHLRQRTEHGRRQQVPHHRSRAGRRRPARIQYRPFRGGHSERNEAPFGIGYPRSKHRLQCIGGIGERC